MCDVHLLLKENASKQDLLFGLIHSYIVRYAMKVKGFSGKSKLNILKKLNLKDELTPESSFDILVRTRELLHSNGNVVFAADNRIESNTKNEESNILKHGISCSVDDVHRNESRNEFHHPHPHSGSGSDSEDAKHMHHDDYNDNYNYFNNNNRSVGLVTVKEILASQWLVEELLLETRHARLEVRNTQFRCK